MRRHWWETIKERQDLMRENNEVHDPKEPTKRRPYQWGAKEYLAGFEVGESRAYVERFSWNSLKSIASKMKNQFGVQFLFNTINNKRYITRVL